MYGFIFSTAYHGDYSVTEEFQGQESVEIDNLKFIYSSKNCAHNSSYFLKDNAPFVFIYGEVNTDDVVMSEKDNPARWLSIQIKRDGVSAIKKLNGLYSIVVYDNVKKVISICTDSIGGFCTLYYHLSGDGLFCSTSFKHVAHRVSNLAISPDAISQLIATGYVLPQRTLARDIYKLGPGCLATVSDGQISETNFFALPFLEKKKSLEPSTGENYILSYLQRYADSNACFLLSGGLDSSTLVGMAAKELGRQVSCYTGVFTGCGHLDESGYAKIVAKHCGIDLICVELGHENVLHDLPMIVKSIGEPFLDYSILPTYALFKEIKNNFGAVISGDGPDHLFNRYYSLAMKRSLGFMARHISFLPRQNKYVNRLWRSSSEDIEYTYSELFALPHWGHNQRSEMLALLNPDFRCNFKATYSKSMLGDSIGKTHADNLRIINFVDFYIDGSFGVFSKVGKASSALGLLIREPYLASPYAGFAAGLPMEEKIRGGFYAQLMSKCTTKAHLRDNISRKYLPESIITRKKGGFTPPLETWLQNFLLRTQAFERFSKTSQALLNISYVNFIFKEFLDKKKYGCLVFMLISFDLWVRIFIEKQNCSKRSLCDIYD